MDVPYGSEYYEGEDDEGMYAMRSGEESNDTDSHETNTDLVMASTVFPIKENGAPKEVKMRKHKLVSSQKTRMRPKYTEEEKRCLATWVEINGLRAWTL